MYGQGCQTVEDVLKEVRDKEISFIQIWFTDILGVLKSFSIRPSELEEAMTEGMGFDGSSIEGFARIEESDMIAKPDPTTFAILPWRPEENPVARMFCDILQPDTSPYPGDPRYALKRILAKAAEKGYTYLLGPELEYFYFKSSAAPDIIDTGGYFDAHPWIRPTISGATASSPWSRWASASSIATTRWPPPSTRSICDTTRGYAWPIRP
jgi:glutamine synthetase